MKQIASFFLALTLIYSYSTAYGADKFSNGHSFQRLPATEGTKMLSQDAPVEYKPSPGQCGEEGCQEIQCPGQVSPNNLAPDPAKILDEGPCS